MSARYLRLREDVDLRVLYEDRTRFGSGFTGLSDRLIQRSCEPLRRAVAAEGWDAVTTASEFWMERIMASRALGSLFESPERLREECIYPAAELVNPVGLSVVVPGGSGKHVSVLRVPAGGHRSLAPWISEWQRGASQPNSPVAAALWNDLMALNAFESAAERAQPLADGLTFVGHATLAVQAAGIQLLFDPYLIPPSEADPPDHRPHTACDLNPTAVFITHSHEDHYNISTLIRFPFDTPIYVPVVERESLLATDMALRLRQLGFARVHTLAWHDEVRVGPFRVVALPFYGEQPTDGGVLHPEARNAGNTYLVEGLEKRIALVADAGRDVTGSTIEMSSEIRTKHGPLDVYCGGYRAWRIQPIRYIGSSISRYLLFVPPGERTKVHKIMNDADDCIASAAAWGARSVMPYANGGAPWFARLGLGPHGTAEVPDDINVDPPLQTVSQALAHSGWRDLEVLEPAAGHCIPLFEREPK